MTHLNPDIPVQRRVLENGAIEETHTLPKHQYYASLRVGSTMSVARNSAAFNRMGSQSTLNNRTDTMQRSKSSIAVYKPSGKMTDCIVTMLDGEEVTFSIDSASLGRQLMEQVCNHLDLWEKQFFGLRYNDKSLRIWFWLDLDKKISDQVGKNLWLFDFQVKFYTPHDSNIAEDLTRYFFCLQVRQDLIQGIIPASFNVLVLLGSYAVQSEAGDFDESLYHGIDYLKTMPFAPKQIQTDEMLYRIRDLHKDMGYLIPEEADKLFMANSMRLAMYGLDMHKVKMQKNVDHDKNLEVSVGVYHGGIVIYKGRIRISHNSWPKILTFSYKNKNFILKLRPTELDKKEKVFEFNCGHAKLAKRLYLACREHHEFFRMYDPENPRKPQLKPGFGTRVFRTQNSTNPDPSFDSTPSTPNIILQRPQPKVRRTQTQRREKEVPQTPSGIAPVADEDELFKETDLDSRRPKLLDEYWKMTVHDTTADMGIDPDGFDVAATEGRDWQGCRANRGVKGPGKYYYEGKVVEDGLIRLGWSTNDASLDLGSDCKGYGFGDSMAGDRSSGCSWKRNDNQENGYGEPIHEGDIIGSMIDFDKGLIQWTKNGISYGPAFTIPDDQKNEAFFPASSIKDGRVVFNFGDEPLDHCPPKGNWIPLTKADRNNIIPNENCGWRMNPFDATRDIEVSGTGTELQSKLNGQWTGCRANKGVFDAGKYYYEVTPAEDGLARVGWSTDVASLNLGSDPMGFGYGADEEGFGISGNQGKKLNNSEINNYGEPFGKDDVIGCFLDLDNKIVKWSKNGQVFQEAFEIPEELLTYRAFYPTASLLNSTLDFNFGDRAFQFFPGNEWTPVCYAARGNTENSKKFDPSLYRKPKTDRQEDILEMRRQERDKINRLNTEKDRIERSEKERRKMLQKQREEDEARARKERERQLEEEERLRKLKEQEEELERRKRELEAKEEEARRKERERMEIQERYQTVEKSDPEITTETYVDEMGRTVTRTVKKSKIKTTTSVKTDVIDRSEDEITRSGKTTITGYSNKAILDADDEELMNAILFVTGFDSNDHVQNLNELSLSSN